MADLTRTRRLADRIRQILAARLEKGLRDPRLGFVTITEVRLTGDLQQATVFFTVLGDDQQRKQSVEALRAATGFLRTYLARRLEVRQCPTLDFVLDALPEDAQQIDNLLAQARKRDQELAEKARSSSYAGEANPYRTSESEN